MTKLFANDKFYWHRKRHDISGRGMDGGLLKLSSWKGYSDHTVFERVALKISQVSCDDFKLFNWDRYLLKIQFAHSNWKVLRFLVFLLKLDYFCNM